MYDIYIYNAIYIYIYIADMLGFVLICLDLIAFALTQVIFHCYVLFENCNCYWDGTVFAEPSIAWHIEDQPREAG